MQWGSLKSNGLIHRSVGPYSVLRSYPIVFAHCAFASRPHYHYWLCSKNSAIAMVGEAPSERSKQTTDVRVQHGRQNGLKSILKKYTCSYLWTLKSSSFLRFDVTNKHEFILPHTDYTLHNSVQPKWIKFLDQIKTTAWNYLKIHRSCNCSNTLVLALMVALMLWRKPNIKPLVGNSGLDLVLG